MNNITENDISRLLEILRIRMDQTALAAANIVGSETKLKLRIHYLENKLKLANEEERDEIMEELEEVKNALVSYGAYPIVANKYLYFHPSSKGYLNARDTVYSVSHKTTSELKNNMDGAINEFQLSLGALCDVIVFGKRLVAICEEKIRTGTRFEKKEYSKFLKMLNESELFKSAPKKVALVVRDIKDYEAYINGKELPYPNRQVTNETYLDENWTIGRGRTAW